MSESAPTLDKECWQRALAALNRREHSRHELAGKLAAKGFEREQIEPVLGALIDKGWLSDARYAGAMARTRAAGGQGPRRIAVELARKGVDADHADAALASCEVDWRTQARTLVTKRFGEDDLHGGPLARKAMDFLLRRGFDIDTARRALRPDEY